MDDPWGSPWTTADTDKDQKAPPSPTKSDLEPPPRAFLSVSSSPRIPTIISQSPWADEEDGFGDWAAPDAAASAQSGWGGGWPSPSPSLTAPTRDEEFGKSSPIAWPGSIAISKPRSSSIRQPSPDPWAAEFSAKTPTNDGPLTPRPIPESIEPVTVDLKEDADAKIIITSEWDDHPALDSVEKEEPIRDDTFVLPPPEEPAVLEETDKTPTPAESTRSSFESPVRGRTRRSASPSDEDSDREAERQDSPITSIDEDSKTRQKVTRKTSGKVQELVVKFDGLARAASQEPPIISTRARSKSNPDEKSRSPEAAEFGDFEDAHEDVPRRPSTAGENRSTSPPVAEPLHSKRESMVEPISPVSNASNFDSKRESTTKLEPVKFDINVGKVDDLLGKGIKMTAADLCDASLGISDHIITDSFTEISERKTWYRVSRLGSSRKHNAGDDENYRRVGWDTSTVRLDTIKIVRRWMEEDSIAGRANLGGGTSRTQKNMFGWDSSAEPVTLDAVFGKKKAAHARASSLKMMSPLQPPSPSSSFGGSTTDVPRTPVLPNGASQRPLSLALSGPASFGWSTSSPVTQAHPVISQPVVQSPIIAEAPISKPVPPPISQPMQPAPQPSVKTVSTEAGNPLPQPAAASGSLSIVNPSTMQDDDDFDDEDWGEMVSSPSEAKPPMNAFPDIAEAFAAAPMAPPTTSLFEPPTSSGPGAKILDPAPAPATSSDLDAWASVDFSVFEKPVESKEAANPSPATSNAFGPATDTLASLLSPPSAVIPVSTGLTPASAQAAAASSQFTPTTPLEIASPVVLPEATVADLGDTTALDDLTSPSPQDEAVLRIIANLPDLSYMLR